MLIEWKVLKFLPGFLRFMKYLWFEEVMKNSEEQSLLFFSPLLFQQQF